MTLLLKLLDLPSPQNRKRALETHERQFRKSDESAYSIVPSRLSLRFSLQISESEHNRKSCISLESTDLVYRRLSFEDELFTASVYKRNYTNPLIRSLLESGSRHDPSRKISLPIRNDPLPPGQCLPPERTEPSLHIRVPIGHLPAHRFGSRDEGKKSVGESPKITTEELHDALHRTMNLGYLGHASVLLADRAQISSRPLRKEPQETSPCRAMK